MNNLKNLVLIFIYVLLATWTLPDLAFAKIMDSREIEIRAKEEKNIPRSIFPVRAWVDEQVVCVSFIEAVEAATVIVTNTKNGEVITNVYSSPKIVSVPLSDGMYEIEICYGSKSFVGNFEIE